MPDPVAHPVTLPARLELEDGTRLVGDLSTLPGGGLQLAASRVLRKPASGQEPALRAGTRARLAMADASVAAPAASRVKLEQISGDTILLAFTDTDNAADRQLLESLGAIVKPAPRPLATPDEYAAILESFRADSLGLMEKLLKPLLNL